MPAKLYYFNPGHEAAILNGSPYYMAPANVVLMQKDLSFLPAWAASPESYVFMDRISDSCFYKYLKENIENIATPITSDYLHTISSQIQVCPWGLSPQVIHFFENIRSNYNNNLIIPRWNSELSHLSNRIFAKECLKYLCSIIPEVSCNLIPAWVNNIENIEHLVSKSKVRLLAKAPFSSSGRGLLWLPLYQLTRVERQILHGILKKQGSVSIEKVLDKKIDFAMEFNISKSGDTTFQGYSLFYTNNKGGYVSNYLGLQSDILEIISFHIDINLLETVKSALIEILSNKFSGIYSGNIGVDMMVYEENGKNKLHPCVEINVRDNMGIVALRISQNYLSPGSGGSFHIDFKAKDGDTFLFHNEMKSKYPAKLKEKKIKSGYFSLCPVLPDTKYIAYLLVQEK